MPMRTTLTLDPDVAVLLKRVMAREKSPLKTVVNRAIRAGLELMQKPPAEPTAFKTTGMNLGPSLIGSLDDIEDVLSRVEGEDHK